MTVPRTRAPGARRLAPCSSSPRSCERCRLSRATRYAPALLGQGVTCRSDDPKAVVHVTRKDDGPLPMTVWSNGDAPHLWTARNRVRLRRGSGWHELPDQFRVSDPAAVERAEVERHNPVRVPRRVGAVGRRPGACKVRATGAVPRGTFWHSVALSRSSTASARRRDSRSTMRVSALSGRCPRQESNLRLRFRRPALYPLSYGGSRASLPQRRPASARSNLLVN